MTYGENSAAIRGELARLLDQHRIQQRLGGAGSHTVPQSTTMTEREQLGRVVRRYRQALLVWCHQGLRAVSTKTDPLARRKHRRTGWEDLDAQVLRCASPSVDELPLVPLLAEEHSFDLVASWQRAARAAALGEHDFAANVNRGHLSEPQMRAVVADVVDVVSALTVLDARYQHVPGWQRLAERTKLATAAEKARETLSTELADRSVDQQGWQPRVDPLMVPAQPGLAGALEAQRGLIDELEHQPTALNLRRVLYLQARAASTAAARIGDRWPEVSAAMTDRAGVYRQLVSQSRNLGGLLGGGAGAVIAAERVVRALDGSKKADLGQEPAVHQLRRLFTATDARLATVIERGLAQKLYFAGTPAALETDSVVANVARPRERYLPIDRRHDPFVLAVRDYLSPRPTTSSWGPTPQNGPPPVLHVPGERNRRTDRLVPRQGPAFGSRPAR